MASYEAQINIIANGLSKIEKIISKVSQLESIVNSINKKPIDINASSAEKSVESFWQQTKILDANIDSIKKTSDSASKSFETYASKLAAANKILESTNPNTKKYTKALEDQKKAQDGLSQSMYEMGKAELDLAKAQQKREEAGRGLKEAERAKEAAAAIRQLADDYLLLGASQQRSIRDGRILKDQSAVTVSQLTAQGNALMLIANNSKIASSEFNRFSIAAQLASQKSYEAQQKRLGALAFGLSPQAPRVNIGRGGESSIGAARSQVTDLINSYSSIVKSEAAMSAFVARASELQSIVPAISNEFSALEEIIARAKGDLSTIGMRSQSARIATTRGPATNLGSVSAFTQRATYERKVNDELSRQTALEERINQGLLTQVQKTQLLGRLQQGFDALSQNRLEDAQRITREIDKQRFSLERLNRSTGPTKTGQFSPIDGQKQLNAIYSANEMLLAKLNGLEAQGLNVSSEKITLQNQINRIQSGTFDINLKNLDIENNTLAAITRSITLLKQRNSTLKQQATGYPSSPIMGGVNMPGSPIFNQTPFLERRFGKRGGAAISEGLIGGAFPLLFGQGLGSSIGGGLGGALGGFAGGGLGFGLSLIGTALGSAIDGLATAAKDAAAAMRDPITNFQKLADAGLFASKSQELQIKNLIEYGNSARATAVIQEELAKKIGALGMRDMVNLDEKSVKLGRAWAELNLQIQAAIAGPLARLLEWTTSMVELATGINRGNAKRKDDVLRNIISGGEKATSIISGREFLSRVLGFTKDQQQNGRSAPVSPAGTNINPGLLQQEQDKNRQEQRDRDDKQLQRAREVEDYIRNSKTQTRQFEYQAIDLQRQAWDLQRRISDDIFNKQQQLQRDQIANDRLKRQIIIDTVDLQYRKEISNEEGRAAAVLSAEADLVKLRKTNAAEIETARRNLELDIAKQQRETENYIYGLAREADSIRRATLNYEIQVEEMKFANARKLDDMNRQFLRDQEDAFTKTERGGRFGALSQLIGSNESFGGNYGAFNRGGSSGGHVAFGSGVDPNLVNMTIAEIQRRQLAPGVPKDQQLHAVGKYQIIGKTLQSLLAGRYGPTGVSASDRFTPDIQERLGMALAMNRIVPGNMQASVRGLRSEWIGLQNAPTDKLVNAINQMAMGGAVGSSTSNAQAPIRGGQALISAIPNKFKVPGPPVSAIRGQMTTLNANDNRIKKEAIALQEKLNTLGEDAALQRVLEAAKGENTVKQKQRELALIEAEANSIGVMAGDKQAIATFDAKSLETQKQIEEENKRIIERTMAMTELTAKEKKAIADAAGKYLENAKASLAVDRQALQMQQQMRFNSEMAAMRLELQNRGAGARAGFFGAAAQAYNQELTTGSGDPAKAAEKARQTRMNEVNDQIVSMRENLLMLQDPTYQVVESAKAIGSAFSDSFKGVVSGSTTAQQALANFFQRTSDHFLEMAAQMLTQQLVLKLIGFGMNLFAPGASALGGGSALSSAFGGAPSVGFSSAAGMNLGFAKGGVFTNSIVSSPTLFKFANGGALSNGVMGEAGPEAIMPLTRGPGGRLGVDASGSGGGVNVTVNVDAKGSSVQGDDQRSGELGRVIATAVQQELIKQKRSGGILAK